MSMRRTDLLEIRYEKQESPEGNYRLWGRAKGYMISRMESRAVHNMGLNTMECQTLNHIHFIIYPGMNGAQSTQSHP